MNSEDAPNSDVLAARREAERSKHDLARRLRVASRSSREMLEHTLSRTKPLAAAAAALGTAAVVLGLLKLAQRRPRRARWILPPEQPSQPSLLASVARSALTSIAASLATYLTDRLQRTLEPVAPPSTALPASRPAERTSRP